MGIWSDVMKQIRTHFFEIWIRDKCMHGEFEMWGIRMEAAVNAEMQILKFKSLATIHFL